MLKCTPWDQTMSNPLLRTPFGYVELRPVAPPPGAEGMQTYVLLPDLDELLGVPGAASAIRVSNSPAADAVPGRYTWPVALSLH